MDNKEEARIKFIINSSPFEYHGEGSSKYRACVGINGGYDQSTIYDGFKEAVALMLKGIDSGETFSDTIVYPTLYCVRHCIELFLKSLLSSVIYLTAIKRNPDKYRLVRKKQIELSELQDELPIEGLSDSSSLINEELLQKIEVIKNELSYLWDELYDNLKEKTAIHNLDALIILVEKYYNVDERIPVLFKETLPLLQHYRDKDPDGDMYKYKYSNDGTPHFESQGIQHVSLELVYNQFVLMTGLFEHILYNVSLIEHEYQTATFTKDLSREQIEDISKLLPSPQQFSEKIKEAKRIIKEKYGIGNNKIDSIIELIDEHPEFAANRGKEVPLISIREEALALLAKSASDILDWNTVFRQLNKEEITAFFTFSDISGWRYSEKQSAYYSEDFQRLYSKHLKRWLDEHSIVPKQEYDYIIEGMIKCGQTKYANLLKQLRNECQTEHRE